MWGPVVCGGPVVSGGPVVWGVPCDGGGALEQFVVVSL